MLDCNDTKVTLRRLFKETLQELDPGRALSAVKPTIERFLLQGTDTPSPRLIAFGKAAVPMTRWFLDAFGLATIDGVLSAPDAPRSAWRGVRCFTGGHPVPNPDSLGAAAAALELARSATERDPLIFLVSGGGSALLELPIHPAVGLDDMRRLNALLVTCGADIVEVNVIRKHLSAVKGGRLALAAFPAPQLTLYVSDVPVGKDSSVASGPTMPDESKIEDLRRIVAKYGLGKKLPEMITALLNGPTLAETPKPGDRCFEASQWICILENRHAIEAATRFARARGWRTAVDTSVDDREVGQAAEHLLDRLRRMRVSAGNVPVCVISGGELSSPVRGSGIGGRNQAFVLECARRIAAEPIAVLSAGTDGVDGNSPAAGAVADGTTIKRAKLLGLDPGAHLDRSDSHSFFRRLGDDVTSGATGTNVRDIRVLVSHP